MCISILKIVLEIYMKDKMNYFILEKHYPFYLFVDTMASKGSLVQVCAWEPLIETILILA
jgi:hypothetical protein